MSRGPRPLPVALHRQKGSFRKARHGDTPEPEARAPQAPKGIDPEVKKIWDYHARRLAKVKVLSELDQQALYVYCCAAARMAKAEKAIATMGEVIKTPAGFAAPNPWIGIAQKCTETMLRYGAELGLTPASRCKIRVPPKEPATTLPSRSRRGGPSIFKMEQSG